MVYRTLLPLDRTVHSVNKDNKISSVLLTSFATLVEKIAGLKVTLGREIEE